MLMGDIAYNLAIYLFGPWLINVMAAQSRFDMANWDLAIISGQRADHSRCGIALNDDAIGLRFVQYHPNCLQQARGERVK